jgi:hypothetical protein
MVHNYFNSGIIIGKNQKYKKNIKLKIKAAVIKRIS